MALALPPLRPLSSSASASASAAPSSSSTSFNYRPAVILPGLGNNSSDYNKLEVTLKEHYGVPTVVAKVSRLDWLRNAAGLADPNYWSGTLRPRPVLDWYLKRVDDAIREAKELAPGGTLSLIGHSAGGWLARLYMEEFGLSHISLLLTLGTPHLPPPKGVPVKTQNHQLVRSLQRPISRILVPLGRRISLLLTFSIGRFSLKKKCSQKKCNQENKHNVQRDTSYPKH